ncbi:TPA: MBL fold metallo-hydrolase [Candidatus Bathyarchaeota archaeon]|nr:MBL fold metallo-hydrolase [Candidatus Bathyarchaeota archaeon]
MGSSKGLSLTFYGGANEVGGNKILLQDGDTKIIIDFGMSFNLRRKYYADPFLSPRNETGLLEFGLLPKIRGIYRFEKSKPTVDGVIISHSHMDHAAYLSFLKREIPIYCGEATATILEALHETRIGGFEFDMSGVNFVTFRTGDVLRIGSLEIEPIHVDHSVPGSYGFLIQTSAGPIAYTGDFRMHGSKPTMTDDFIERASEEKPIVIISEGTNAIGVEISSESEVQKKISRIVRETSGIVLANFSWADIDRLRSFYTAALENDRHLVLTMKQAYLLDKLKEDIHLDVPKLDDDRLLIFQKSKRRLFAWEKKVLDLGKVIDSEEIAKMQNKIILILTLYGMEELIGINPRAGSSYIFSSSEPFNEEMEVDFNKLINWLSHYGLPLYHAHVSGHVAPLQLKAALRKMNAKKIFLIHGSHLDLLSRFLKDLKSKILIPIEGVHYKIKC